MTAKIHTTTERDARRGTATVELAVCLPVLALLVFGSIQACDMIFLKHAVTAAAYEASLELTKQDATNDAVASRVEQVLTMRGIEGGTLTLKPAGIDLATAAIGTSVTVEVTADVGKNLMLSGFFATPSQVKGRVVAVR